MKICGLLLRNFGKFTDKEITFSDGIQLLYGENESGKSTIHTFIKGMLFGMERGRGRAAATDEFSTYEPWDNPGYYSGRMRIETGGKHFVIERNFDKIRKNVSVVCEEDGETLSVEDGDLDMLLDGMSMSTYENTFYVAQLKAKPGESIASEVENYAASYYVSGDSDLDVDGAISMLKQERKEAEKKAQERMEEKQDRRERLEQEASYIWRDIRHIEDEQEKLAEEIAFRRAVEEGQDSSVRQGMLDEIRPDKWRIHPLEILAFVLVIVGTFAFVSRPWNSLVAIVLFLCFFIYVWNRIKVGKKQEKPGKKDQSAAEEEIPLERLLWESEHNKEELRDKQIQYGNIQEELVELTELSEEDKEYEQYKQSIELAMGRIESLSANMQKKLRTDLNSRASEIISEITGGKYRRLVTEKGLIPYLLLSDGRKISIRQVSRGTVEQIYFALRMAIGEFLYEEDFPVILDDTFAYYDDVRLEQTLKWLYRNRRQVLIFTCQKREEEALKKIGIPYHMGM